ncbi:hypothetical protein MASR2M8_17750 [Opitutaceae bacterium]
MEFPTYQLAVAAVAHTTSLPLESAGRLVSVIFFLACLPPLHLLLRDRLPQRSDSLVVLAFVLTGPIYLFYSRTFFIESTALCLALWFLVVFERALLRPRSGWLPAAWAIGALAATTKITTFAVFCPPAVILTCLLARDRRRAGIDLRKAWVHPLLTAALVAAVPVAAGLAWVSFTDAIKADQPYARMLTSASLRAFNFGPPELRISRPFWQFVGYVTSHQVSSLVALLLAAIALPFVGRTYRHVALVCGALYCTGFLVFSNLYFVHDYYYYASGIFLLTALAVIAAGLMHQPKLPRLIPVATLVLALCSQVMSFGRTYHDLFHRKPPPPPPVLATVVRDVTRPEDVLVTLGLDWNGLYAYTAERRAIMVFASHTDNVQALESSLDGLGLLRPGALIVAGSLRHRTDLVQSRLELLGLASVPVASTANEDLYVRSDLHTETALLLGGRLPAGTNLGPPIAPSQLTISGGLDLLSDEYASRFTMITPRPAASRGPHAIGLDFLDGVGVAAVHAPTEIIVDPPSGADTVEAQGGLRPAAYQDGNLTDGVTVVISEQRPNGLRRILYRRTIDPLANATDRDELVIRYQHDRPFIGQLIFGIYPGPSGNASYDWGYWRSIQIH